MSDFDDFYKARYEAAATPPKPEEPSNAKPEIKKLTQAELKKDPQFIKDAWTWFNASEEHAKAKDDRYDWQKRGQAMLQRGMESPIIKSDDDVAEWAFRASSKFNNNLSQMAIDWQEMRKQPVGNIRAMLNVIESYDRTPTTGSQVVRGLANTGTDPLTVMGITAVGKALGQKITGAGVKGYMRSMLGKTISNPAVLAASEGMAMGGATGHVKEDLTAQAGIRDYNPLMPMVYAGVGGVIGGTLGAAITYGPGMTKGLLQKFKGFRGGGEGASMTDSRAAAKAYGEVQEKTIEAQSPIFLGAKVSVDEFAEKLDLDEAQTKQLVEAFGGDARTAMQTSDFVREEIVQDAMKFRGVDMVGYPEKLGGLDMGQEARMSRAKDLGFDTDKVWYHGSKSDFKAFDDDSINSRFESSIGHHFTDRPPEASQYAEGEGGNVMQAFTKSENPLVITTGKKTASLEADINKAEITAQIEAAKKAGTPYDAVIINRRVGDGNDDSNFISLKPDNIKSTNAKFATGLGGVAVSGDLLAKDQEDPMVSLDQDGTYMSYREIGREVIEQ